VLESFEDQWRMPVTSGVAPVLIAGAGAGWSGARTAMSDFVTLTEGTGRVLALMDCSTCFPFQTTAQPSPMTIGTRAAVRRMLETERGSLGSDPGASMGAGLEFSTGSGPAGKTTVGTATAVSLTTTGGAKFFVEDNFCRDVELGSFALVNFLRGSGMRNDCCC